MAKKERNKGETALDLLLPSSTSDSLIQDITSWLDEFSSSSVQQAVDPWVDACEVKARYLRENLLSKYVGEETATAEERKSAAIAKWLSMEERNARTNIRLLIPEVWFNAPKGRPNYSWDDVVVFARKVVQQIIGKSPREDILDGMFTGGASTRVKRGVGAIASKFVGEANTTEAAWALFSKYVLDGAPLWARCYDEGVLQPAFVPGSVLFTVPKNSEIDRVACKEPEINMYMQRGVGIFIRDRLRKRGIDLTDQSRNRDLARRGSASGQLATLDLSSASDLISEQLVMELLPFDWYDLLDSIRVKSVNVDGVEHDLCMFSSMGNGFTFELQSMIFYALACAVCYLRGVRGSVSVYGDDIIVPTVAAKPLIKVLQYAGLRINTRKSCVSGYFRESCGGHYYHGLDVSPFFIREPVKTVPQLILVLNQWRAWCTQEDVAIQYAKKAGLSCWALWTKYAVLVKSFLHGGRDVGSPYALVTDSPCRMVLKPVTRVRVADAMGSYLHWMRGREMGEMPMETSLGTIELGLRRARNKDRDWNPTLPASQCWWEELVPPLVGGASVSETRQLRAG